MAAAQDGASAALQECVAQFEPSDESPGLKEIEERCPELKSVLDNSPYAAWFPENWWGQRLTPDSLVELQRLIERESAAPVPRTVDTAGVAAALASLGEDTQAAEVTWWDRLREWLRGRLQPDAEDPPLWLFKWLDELSKHETAVRITGYVLFALIVLTAGWVVFNELRASGVFGTRAQRLARSAAADAQRTAQALTLDDLERSDPANRPSLLLTLLMGALSRRQDRTLDVSYTHRELAARVSLESDWQRSAFGQLLRCAERVRYAPEIPPRVEIDQAVIAGRRLLEALSQPAAAAAT